MLHHRTTDRDLRAYHIAEHADNAQRDYSGGRPYPSVLLATYMAARDELATLPPQKVRRRRH